jgi:hypothetical protein
VTLDQGYFDRLYREHEDPWGFRSRWYEARKRRLTMAALPDEHYRTVFEPGCSIGVLTSDLASRSDRVLAMDVASAAVRQARCVLPDHVEVRLGSVLSDWPEEEFDLIVLSELGYYFERQQWRRLSELAVESTRDLIAVHWRHSVADYPLGGDEVHRVLAESASRRGLTRIAEHVEADFRIDVWSSDQGSVASRTGLLNR